MWITEIGREGRGMRWPGDAFKKEWSRGHKKAIGFRKRSELKGNANWPISKWLNRDFFGLARSLNATE